MATHGYYRSFSQYLRERYGEKVFRLCIDAGFTCPNRDGTLGTGGCAYCSEYGSWRSSGKRESVQLQIQREKERVRSRYGARKYIAYFQAFTNTYAPVQTLKQVYDSALLHDGDIVGIAIGTRPDCINHEKLELISSYQSPDREIWVEYGLQSAHDKTLDLIGRGHSVQAFFDAVKLTKRYGIKVLAHVIIGLPGEERGHNHQTAQYLAQLPIDGLKIHNLNIVKGTRIADWYREGKVKPLDLDDYAQRVVGFLELTNPDVVIARLTADTVRSLLIEPKWSLDKVAALDRIRRAFLERKTFQGRLYKARVNRSIF